MAQALSAGPIAEVVPATVGEQPGRFIPVMFPVFSASSQCAPTTKVLLGRRPLIIGRLLVDTMRCNCGMVRVCHRRKIEGWFFRTEAKGREQHMLCTAATSNVCLMSYIVGMQTPPNSQCPQEGVAQEPLRRCLSITNGRGLFESNFRGYITVR